MKTLFYLFSILILVAVGYWSYTIFDATRAAERRVATLDKMIWEETEKIEVLRAEWAYLNRPERLLRLAEANFETLGLVPIRADHYADPGTLARQPADPGLSHIFNARSAAE